MFCMKCGSQIPEGSAFCMKCGAKVEAPATLNLIPEEEPVSQPSQPAEPQSPAASQPKAVPNQTGMAQGQQTALNQTGMAYKAPAAEDAPAVPDITPRKGHKGPVIGAVAACAALAVGGTVFWMNRDTDSDKNTGKNHTSEKTEKTESTEPQNDQSSFWDTAASQEDKGSFWDTVPETPEVGIPSDPAYGDSNDNIYDFGGMEIIIRDWWSSDDADPVNDFEEARQDYREWLQETYNFTIKEVAISDWSSAPTDFIDYVAAGGDDQNYIFTLRDDSQLVSAMKKGYMYDVSQLGVFNFRDAKWGNGVHQKYSVGNSIYAFSAIPMEPRYGMYFNKRLLREAGIDPESIYDLQESGKWTWDKFEEICNYAQRDLDNDGVVDVYGMVSFDTDWYTMAVASNYADYVGKDANGKLTYELENKNTVDALNWAYYMRQNYAFPEPAGATWDYWQEAFSAGRGAFFPGWAYMKAETWKYMTDELGFVCLPKGPHATDYVSVSANNFCAIPACYDKERAEKIALAYELYTADVPGYEGYNYGLQRYYAQFDDVESVRLTIDRLMKNGRVYYHDMVPNLEVGRDLLWNITPNMSPEEAIEMNRDTWKYYIDLANK